MGNDIGEDIYDEKNDQGNAEYEDSSSSSSSSSGDDGQLSDDDESDSSEDSGSQRSTRRKKISFVMPPPRALPQRTTRGKRMGNVPAAVEDDEDADNEFWNQEFFAEEERDDAYETESEPEDKFDNDFLDSEEEDTDGEEEELAVRAAEKRQKKVLKPPGHAAQKRKKQEVTFVKKEEKISRENPAAAAVGVPERTMAVRTSTRVKSEVAKEERRVKNSVRYHWLVLDLIILIFFMKDFVCIVADVGTFMQMKSQKVFKPAPQRQLTQAELLSEAARTEIENTRSLQYLVAVEEENKKRATATGGKYVGPMIRFSSRKGDDGCEHSTLEVMNMQIPEYLQAQVAESPVQRDVCFITGRPAKYKDPLTGLPYADSEAFQQIRQRQKAGTMKI